MVSMKSAPRSVYDEALSGIAGPVFGAVGAFAVLGLAGFEDSDFLRALAYTGFLLNLFNLLPFLPLDGGRTAAAVSPKLWLVGLAGLLAYEIYRPSPIIPLILIVGGLETYRRWRGRDTAASQAYYALTPQQRVNIGTAYIALIGVLIWAMHSYPVPHR
jgi:Zn-dependent protease